MEEKKLQIGGQAVIEGVMMRSKDAYSVAVRRRDGSILVRKKPFVSWVRRHKLFAMPILRGAFVLVESLILGVMALTFSGDVAAQDEKQDSNTNGKADTGPALNGKRSFWEKAWLFLTVCFSFAIGLFLFFYVPLILTDWFGAETGVTFNLIDGLFRLLIFLAYLFLITMMKDIRRVFEYHGAEHKSIFAFESNLELTPLAAKDLSRFHPRCGTSFLLIVMIVSIFVFMLLGKPESISDRLLRLTLIPVIGGVSYELIRLSEAGARSSFWRPFILPGLWLQRLTTREPDEAQLEVAIVALKTALGMDIREHKNVIFDAEEKVAPMQEADQAVRI